jgi:hypothetical protein
MSFVTDDIVSMSPNDTTIYGKPNIEPGGKSTFNIFITAFSGRGNVTVNGVATELADYMIAVAPVGGGTRLRRRPR